MRGQPSMQVVFQWLPIYEMGDPHLDAQHRGLVGLLNQMATHYAEGAPLGAWEAAHARLMEYTRAHFRDEERAWADLAGDERYEAHRRAHADFSGRLAHLTASGDDRTILRRLLVEAARWLATHILDHDPRLHLAVIAYRRGLSVEAAHAAADAQMSGRIGQMVHAVLSIHIRHFEDTLDLLEAQRRQRESDALITSLRARWETHLTQNSGGWRSALSSEDDANRLAQVIAEHEAILAAVPDPILLLDAVDGTIIAAGAPAAVLLDRPVDTLLGLAFATLAAESERAELQRRLTRLRVTGATTERFDSLLVRADGEPVAVEITGARGQPMAGRALVVLVVRDLTARLAAERARAAAQEQLREVLEHLPAGLLATDAFDHRLVFSNGQIQRMLGYDAAALARLSPLDLHPPETLPRVRAEFERLAAGDQSPAIDVPVLRKDGSILFADIHMVTTRLAGQPTVLALFVDVTARHAAAEALLAQRAEYERLRTRDLLTDLANRTHLVEQLDQALADPYQHLTLVTLDLDDFAGLSQRVGRAHADTFLRALAGRLADCVPTPRCVARLGHDEFALLWAGIPVATIQAEVLPALLATLAALVPGEEGLTACAGIAGRRTGDDGAPPSGALLLRQSTRALYAAKQQGPGRTMRFEEAADRMERARIQRRQAFMDGLARDEIVLHYQPKVALRTGELVGLEALVRWQHPVDGLLGPGRFLPDLEGDQAIVDLGDHVLRQALDQLSAWWQAGLRVPVSVNLDQLQIEDPSFLGRAQAALDAHPDLPGSALEFEILESAAVHDIDGLVTLIRRLGERGVRFSLDDFGTGYGSLTFLKRLPGVAVKIDQSFVRDMIDDLEQTVIIDGILGMARGLGRDVIAEGVELEVHGTRLLNLGCELGQGYAIARPMPAAEIPRWRAAWSVPEAWRSAEVFDRDELPMRLASWEHERWRTSLERAAIGEGPAPVLDVAQCPLERWWRHGRLGGGIEGSLLEQHRAIHALGAHTLGAVAAGRPRALETFRSESDRFLASLGKAQQGRLALSQTARDKTPLPF